MIENKWLKWYDFEEVSKYMDMDICEEINSGMEELSQQEYYDRYVELHFKKYGEEFLFDVRSPQY